MDTFKKVASSSSRVLASLQAASERLTQQASASGLLIRKNSTTDMQAQTANQTAPVAMDQSDTTTRSIMNNDDLGSPMIADASNQTAAQLMATAQLKDYEKEILRKVFEREEEFRQATLR